MTTTLHKRLSKAGPRVAEYYSVERLADRMLAHGRRGGEKSQTIRLHEQGHEQHPRSSPSARPARRSARLSRGYFRAIFC